MQKNKTSQIHNLMRDIMNGSDNISTTEKSTQNVNWENNRQRDIAVRKPRKGRRLTSREMSKLRRLEQIYTDDIQTDADVMRGFKVS